MGTIQKEDCRLVRSSYVVRKGKCTIKCNPGLSSSSAVAIHGLTGHNEWLASAGTGSKTFTMEVSTTDAGFYPIVVELLRVG